MFCSVLKRNVHQLQYRRGGLVNVAQVNDWLSAAATPQDALSIFFKFIRFDLRDKSQTSSTVESQLRRFKRQQAGDDDSGDTQPQKPQIYRLDPRYLYNPQGIIEPNIATFVLLMQKLLADSSKQQHWKDALSLLDMTVRKNIPLDFQLYERLMDLILEQSGCHADASPSQLFDEVRTALLARTSIAQTEESIGYPHLNQQGMQAEMQAIITSATAKRKQPLKHCKEFDDEFYSSPRNLAAALTDLPPRQIISHLIKHQQIVQYMEQLPPSSRVLAHPHIGLALSIVQQCRRSHIGRDGLFLLPQLFAVCLRHHDTKSALLVLDSLSRMMDDQHSFSLIDQMVREVRQTTDGTAEKDVEYEARIAKEQRHKLVQNTFTNVFVDTVEHFSIHLNALSMLAGAGGTVTSKYESLAKEASMTEDSKAKGGLEWMSSWNTLQMSRGPQKPPSVELQQEALRLSTLDLYFSKLQIDMHEIAFKLWTMAMELKWADNDDTIVFKKVLLEQERGRRGMDMLMAHVDTGIATAVSRVFGSLVAKYQAKRKQFFV